jgi:hypothetical protein
MIAFFLIGIMGIINARGDFILAHPPVTFDDLKAIGKG